MQVHSVLGGGQKGVYGQLPEAIHGKATSTTDGRIRDLTPQLLRMQQNLQSVPSSLYVDK